MKTTYFIAWWNLENLFDVYNSPDRPDWLQKGLNAELKGWTSAVMQKKIDNLCQVIGKMNNGIGPDILGVCEVENKTILEKLVSGLAGLGRNYGIAIHEMSDKRGIDIAFIYDKSKFIVGETFSHSVLKRTATRDIFQANFTTKSGRPFILIGNHWPARSAGILESEPARIIAAETLSYWLQRITEIRGNDIPVIVMGDFNDEPFSRSVTDYALATNSATNVIYAQSTRLFNLMWPMLARGEATYFYNNFPLIIDQFMVTKELIKSTGKFRIAKGGNGDYLVKIERFAEMTSGGRYPLPIRFSRPSDKSGFNPKGFSDHFPISMIVGF